MPIPESQASPEVAPPEGLVREDPPPSGTGHHRDPTRRRVPALGTPTMPIALRAAVVDYLARQDPDRWYQVWTGGHMSCNNTAVRLRKMATAGAAGGELPDGRLETTSRGRGFGNPVALYARYVSAGRDG
jgi:hypothetical protein